MNRWKQHGFKLVALALVTAAGGAAYAQVPAKGAVTVAAAAGGNPSANPKAGEKAGEKLDKAGEKIGEKLDKAADKAEEKLDKAADKAEEKLDKAADKVEDKLDDAARAKKKAQHEANAKTARGALRVKVEAALKGQAMTEAMKQELKRHAQRLARLERIKSVAQEAKDDDVVGRADKLIQKENARHDKWMVGFDAKADVKAGAK